MTIAPSLSRSLLLAAAIALASTGMARAADSEEPPKETETTKQCTDGMVYDKAKKECVKADESGFNDTQLYEAARELAYAGQYDNAIKVLMVARDQNDPRILNYLGFANRKAGRMELGMTYYRKALAINANYNLARSYMGQALLDQGDVAGARMQLVEIRDRGGEGSYAYRMLKQALDSGQTY